MITVNGRASEWREGMTVQSLLNEKKYTFKLMIVKINGNIIPKNQYADYQINDNDLVEAIHLMSGG